tara:strand:+ start:75 stop:599 length:525 start_codon:yes stop_codon:yes gene_type:complete
MFIFQKTEVDQYHYPFAEKVNPTLHEFICSHSTVEDENVPGTLQTPFSYKPLLDLKEFQLVVEYVESIILSTKKIPWISKDNRWSLDLLTWWAMIYNHGSFQAAHHHDPAHWSFVYYVNTPKGSSPFIFEESNKKIKPKEGDVILFPAWINHRVPPNKCEGRTTIVGNFYWSCG